MKPIIYAILLLIITSCASQQSTIKNADVIYEAVTRGSSKKIIIINNTLNYKTNNTSKTVTISLDDRNDLNNEIDKLNLQDLENLPAPTHKRLYYKALSEKLTIKINEKTYTSSTFDDGFPPVELKSIVNLLERLV